LVGTSLLVAAPFYATLPSTTAGATAITATAVVIADFETEVAAADPDAEVGAEVRARSAVPSRSAGAPRAGAAAGAASSAFVFLAVSAGLLLTLFAGGLRMARYPVLRMESPERSLAGFSEHDPSRMMYICGLDEGLD
jgi:hypothetical protein